MNATSMRAYVMNLLKANRRPVFLATLSAVLLISYLVLVRVMAHGKIAHVLLGGGASSGDTAIAITLVIVRFVTVVLVPGLVLASFAELAAYVLVGPRREVEEDDVISTE
jgi:hypothetical protein